MIEQDRELDKLSLECAGASLRVTPSEDGSIIVDVPGGQVVIDRWGHRGPVEKPTEVRLGY